MFFQATGLDIYTLTIPDITTENDENNYKDSETPRYFYILCIAGGAGLVILLTCALLIRTKYVDFPIFLRQATTISGMASKSTF